jgi:hypothetical protein
MFDFQGRALDYRRCVVIKYNNNDMVVMKPTFKELKEKLLKKDDTLSIRDIITYHTSRAKTCRICGDPTGVHKVNREGVCSVCTESKRYINSLKVYRKRKRKYDTTMKYQIFFDDTQHIKEPSFFIVHA